MIVRGLLVGALTCAAALVAVPAEAASGFVFEKVQFDPPGYDNTHLNDEWVQIKNRTSKTHSLTGWKVYDRGRVHTYTFPTTSVKAGEVVRVHVGSGTNSARHRYMRLGAPVWNNTGDTAYLYRPDGTRADSCAPSTGTGVKSCA